MEQMLVNPNDSVLNRASNGITGREAGERFTSPLGLDILVCDNTEAMNHCSVSQEVKPSSWLSNDDQ